MEDVVCKFGGSSLANFENIQKVKDIILSSKKRFVVVSAPGKQDKNDIKLTDCLINCFNLSKLDKDFSKFFDIFKDRFVKIKQQAKVRINLKTIFLEIYKRILSHNDFDYDYIISRGEYLSALIISKYLGYRFLDAKDFIFFDKSGEVDLISSKIAFKKLIKKDECYVIPGFYGLSFNNRIKTFSRGGSDLTGAIVALLSDCIKYENYTDVDGFLVANPSIVKNAKIIKELTYKNMRTLTYLGANVLHQDCLKFLKENDIILNLRNTFNSKNCGSLILPDKFKDKIGAKIIGLSGKKDYSVVEFRSYDIQKYFFVINVFDRVLRQNGLRIEQIISSIDCINFIVDKSDFDEIILTKIEDELICEYENNHISNKDFQIKITNNVCLIAIVCNSFNLEILNKIFTSIIKEKDFLFISKSLTESSVFVGYKNDNFENILNKLYKKLF